MVDDRDKQGHADGGGPVALVRRVARRLAALPEVPRVFALAGLILGGVLLVVLLLAYRVVIWGTITLLFAGVLGLTVLALLVVGTRAWLQARARRRATEPQEERADEAAAQPAVQREVDERTALLQAIGEGRIEPITEPVALLLREGELLWYCCQAWRSEGEGEEHAGELYVTSLRVAFISDTAPLEIPIANLSAVKCEDEYLRLIGRSSTETCGFAVTDAELTAAYIGYAGRGGRHAEGAAPQSL